MRKVTVLFFLWLFVPLGLSACTNRTPAADVSQAQVKLHEAEQYFARAQTAIISLARTGVLKGQPLAIAKKAEAAAYEALKIARTAVDNKNATALQLTADALVKVLQLVATYAPGMK